MVYCLYVSHMLTCMHAQELYEFCVVQNTHQYVMCVSKSVLLSKTKRKPIKTDHKNVLFCSVFVFLRRLQLASTYLKWPITLESFHRLLLKLDDVQMDQSNYKRLWKFYCTAFPHNHNIQQYLRKQIFVGNEHNVTAWPIDSKHHATSGCYIIVSFIKLPFVSRCMYLKNYIVLGTIYVTRNFRVFHCLGQQQQCCPDT